MEKISLDFKRDKLANGLKIVTLEDHSHPIVTYQVHFATGSRNERSGITGISHPMAGREVDMVALRRLS